MRGYYVQLYDAEVDYYFFDELDGEAIVYNTLKLAKQRVEYLKSLNRFDSITIVNIN